MFLKSIVGSKQGKSKSQLSDPCIQTNCFFGYLKASKPQVLQTLDTIEKVEIRRKWI